MSPLTWVVGRGGLLGACVERTLDSPVWRPELGFPWNKPQPLRESIAEAVRGFRDRILTESWDSWCVYWCAGRGVVGASAASLAAETATLQFFLDRLGGELASPRPAVSGRIFLVSSAGGLYGGSDQHPSTEETPPRPISDYGRAKLDQEQALRDWVKLRPHVSTLVGRLSNLYGPGQHIDKPQGLISHMSRCVIFGVPIQIYVPLDTIRDYLFAQDAAKQINAGMTRLGRESSSGGREVIKVYSSGKETTVAGLIGVYRQIAKRHLRVVLGLSPARSQQPARLQFRSIVWCDEPAIPGTELFDGVSRLHRYQLALFQAGKLPPPWSAQAA